MSTSQCKKKKKEKKEHLEMKNKVKMRPEISKIQKRKTIFENEIKSGSF